MEESLKRFEEGMALARICRAKLEEAEGRIERLVAKEGPEGPVETEPFELEED